MMTTHEMVIERDRMFTENANKAVNVGVITSQNLRPFSKNPIIANFFHQIGRADELGSGVRNLYHYVRIYSGADPVFDEGDVFRLTVPLDDDYSPEKGRLPKRGTTQQTTQEIEPHKSNGTPISQPYKIGLDEVTTQKTEAVTTQKAGQVTAQKTDSSATQKIAERKLSVTAKQIMAMMKVEPKITTVELARRLGLSRDGVNYHIRVLKNKKLLRRNGPDKGGHWEVH